LVAPGETAQMNVTFGSLREGGPPVFYGIGSGPLRYRLRAFGRERCLSLADYVRRLAATRAPPPQRANVGYAPAS